jgi:penicillin-binding protein 1A
LLSPKRAKERQQYVLHRMQENGYISPGELKSAGEETIRIYEEEDLNLKTAPYYVENIRRYLVEKYGEKSVYEEGLTVFTPVRPEVAIVARKSVREGLLAVDKRIGFRGPVTHLNSKEEQDAFADGVRKKAFEKKVRFKLWHPDGQLDLEGAARVAGIGSDQQLFEAGEFYEAVVSGFDPKRRVAFLRLGSVPVELPIEKMRWARPMKDEKNPNAPRPEPSQPSQILQKGDVVWVSPIAAEGGAGGGVRVVALEQKPAIQGALFSMDVSTGEVLSMVGGYDFEGSEFNRATQAARQPGSAFKPIIYASALERGFTPASVIVDSPIVFKNADGATSWKPNNYEEKFYGDTTFRQALIKSRNIPTVKIVQSVTVPYLIQYARRLGMNSQFNADLSISLGSGTLSLMDLTKIYALFPRLGRKIDPVLVSRLEDRSGRVLEEVTHQPMPSPDAIYAGIRSALAQEVMGPGGSGSGVGTAGTASGGEGSAHGGAAGGAASSLGGAGAAAASAGMASGSGVAGASRLFPSYPLAQDPNQVLDPRVAYVMTHLMKEVVSYGTGHEAKNLGRVAAGKTGTTNDSVDAWFMGFTPSVVTGVWVGYDNSKSLGSGETGARAALPIWLNFMKTAVQPYTDSDFSIPPGIVFASIDVNTGHLAAPNSSGAIKEAFIEGTQPTETKGSAQLDSEAQADFYREDRD